MRTLSDGDRLHGPDWVALARDVFANGTVILSGCAPSKGTGDSVDVASGTAASSPSNSADTLSVAAANVSLAARDTFDRFDLITIDGTGAASKTTGTAELTAPDIPAGNVLVAIVRVPADGTVAITVKDARALTAKAFIDTLYAETIDAQTGKFDFLNAVNEQFFPKKTADPSTPGTAEMWYREDID